jgi:two-component system, OmpR family, phosphate regulon sensor histidine kinase PhoR
LRVLDVIAGFVLGLVLLAVWEQYWRRRLSRLLRLFGSAAASENAAVSENLEISGNVATEDEIVLMSPLSRIGAAIDHQKRLIQQQAEQLLLWQQVLEVSPLAYLQVDRENRLIKINPKASNLLDLEGRDRLMEDRRDPGSRRLLLQIIRSYELDQLIIRTRKTGCPQQQDWLYHPPLLPHRHTPTSGQAPSQVHLRTYSFPLINGDVGVFLEDRREAVILREERDRWISDVAHELKTPLTSMRLVAETLQERVDPPLRRWVDRFLNETVRLGDLVQDLLELGRLTMNPRASLNLSVVDLPQLIQQVFANLEPLAQQKQVQLQYQGPEEQAVQVDAAQFLRALFNLVDNAIRHSPTLGNVQIQLILPTAFAASVSSIPPSHEFCLEVIDEGAGFAPGDLPHVFERFYRAETSRVRDPDQVTNKGGSGLGLAIVQQIITAHQGVITAQNHPQTGGAWMRILLPEQLLQV